MDFCPPPSNSSVPTGRPSPRIEVPYVANFTYELDDLEGFESFILFPDRHGFLKNGDIDVSNRSVDEYASLLQSWLYFGLISEFLNQQAEVQKFVHLSRQQEGQEFVRWRPHGPEILANWSKHMNDLDRGAKMAAAARCNSLLQLAAHIMLHLDQSTFSQTSPIPTLSLSIKTLLEVLYGHLQSHYKATLPRLPVLPYPNMMPPSTKLLITTMTDQGWCPSQVYRLLQQSSHYGLVYLCQVDRRTTKEITHNGCSLHRCIANNVDMRHYETKHRTHGCSCSFVEIPKAPLIEIIKAGRIPVVSVHAGPHETIEIQVEQADPSSKYTAISHVWSDGLGNPRLNALPQCQLEWLSSCLKRLPSQEYQGIYYDQDSNIIALDVGSLDAISQSSMGGNAPLFWMDTLCVPVDDEYAELRTEAINKMAAYYAQATGTLVLDAELQGLRIAVTDPDELLARIAYCAWAGRCWTLQEGAITPICYFQCADGAIQLDGTEHGHVSWLLETSASGTITSFIGPTFRKYGKWMGQRVHRLLAKEESAPLVDTGLRKAFLQIILDDFQVSRRKYDSSDFDSTMRLNESMQNHRFVKVWNQLSQRTTTKFEDIYVIMANLLDFHAGQIMKLPAEERMKAILWSGRYIPLSLLYNDGPRLNPGKDCRERWVPSTPRGIILSQRPCLEFVGDGLLLPVSEATEHTNMVLCSHVHIKRYAYMVDAVRGKTYLVKAIRADVDEVQTEPSIATCCILERPEDGASGTEMKGACLSITGMKRLVSDPPENLSGSGSGYSTSPFRLVTIYDCPIRAWVVKQIGEYPISEQEEYQSFYESQFETVPVVQVEHLKGQWELIMQTETSFLTKPYPRRPFPAAPDLLFSLKVLLGLAILFIGLPLNLLFTVKWVQRLEPLSKPSIAAIILFYLSNANPPFAIAGIIANCLNLLYGSHHQLRQIFIWWITQLVVLGTPAVLLLILWHFSLREYAYAAWLSTFDEDWTENNDYGLWWKLISFDLWLSGIGNTLENIGDRVDRPMNNLEKLFKRKMPFCFPTWNKERFKFEMAEREELKKKKEHMEFDDALVERLLN